MSRSIARLLRTLVISASVTLVGVFVFCDLRSSELDQWARQSPAWGARAQAFDDRARQPSDPRSVLNTSRNIQPSRQDPAADYGKLPMSFEPNAGQTDKRVKFLSRGSGYSLFLTSTEAVLGLNLKKDAVAESQDKPLENPQMIEFGNETKRIMKAGSSRRDVLRVRLVGARPAPKVEGIDKLPGKSNYFIGKEPSNWHTDISTYRRVRYQSAYPGVDVVYYGNQGNLEYDLVVRPHASYKQIGIRYDGLKSLRIDNTTGDLILTTDAGSELRQHKPIVYQDFSGKRRTIKGSYQLKGEFEVAFRVGKYDPSKSLVIDPVLVYSTFLGGTGSEQGLAVAVDSQGSAYITGSTTSTDFPIANAYQGVKGAVDDAFVVKLNPAGTSPVYSTYIGGNGSDVADAIAVDAQGNAYIAGLTGSGSFPTTAGAFQTSNSGFTDGFVTEVSPSGGSLVYSTYLGGNNSENIYGIAVDATGRAYVVGRTDSTQLNFFALQRHGNPFYKSIDAATNWVGSSTDLTGSIVNSVTIDPSSAGTIYAGTNTGVFKSIDAGAHWSLTGTVRTSTAPGFTTCVAVDPSNSSIVYAGAIGGGVYKSTNGGPLYDQKNSGLFNTSVNALAVDPVTPTTLYVGTQLGIYKSTNGADSWVEVKNGISGSSPRVNEIVIDPANPSTVYIGTNRGMFKTTNGGALWSAINGGALSSLFIPEITALVIDPLSPSTLYASGRINNDVLFKTVDGGATWTGGNAGLTYTIGSQTFIPTINTLAIDSITTATLYAASSGGGIYKSTNGGANWSQSNTGLTNVNTNAVTVDRINPAIIYAGANISSDAFILRLNPTGSAPEYFLSFGGDEFDEARGVAVDSNNNAYIVGTTNSPNFPVQNAYQSIYAGVSDGFVAKVNAAGTGFVYSTFLGGSSSDAGRAIAVRADRVYVAGLTTSANFPLMNPIKSTLAEFDLDGFVSGFNSAGSALDFSTYLGGESADQAFGIAVDNTGIYVTGSTGSLLFPVSEAPQPQLGGGNDAFVTKLNSAGTSIVYSTYLGGSFTDAGNGIAVDSSGNAYVVGNTSSSDFPTVRAFQATVKGTDAFITKIGVEADLSVAKRDSRDPVLVNSPFTYTLTVNNAGPSSATGVTVVDTLPPSLSVNAATPTQGTCSVNNSVVTCSLGSVASNTGALIAVSVTPTATGTINNTATVSGNEPDANSANNTASETTKISASPSIRGRVRDSNNVGVSGVLMTLTGTQSGTVLTDSSGFYQFAELPIGGNYVITPGKANLAMDPESTTFNNLNSDQSADFVASSCTYSLTPATQSFGAAGNTGTVNVNSLHGCPWTATSSVDWINITSGATGVGSGFVNYTVSPTNAPRAGHLTIAGLNFPVYQEFNSCSAPSYSVATYNLPVPAVMAGSADLNGDASVDVVVQAHFSGGDGAVLLNNGAGSFSSTVFDPGFEPPAMAIGNFNSDNKPDLAFINYNFSVVRILFNNGSGGFGQAVSDIPFTSQGQSPLTRGMFSADLNNDAKPDLLVWTPGASAVQVLLSNGNGSFTQVAPVVGTSFDVPIGIADVNADGVADLIYGGGGDNSRPISVRIGNGAGGFGTPIVSAGMSVTAYMGTGDFNGDGKLDLAASAVGGNANTVEVLTGNGAGVFNLKSSVVVGQGSIPNLTVADFNRDGKADIAFAAGGSKVTVLLGDGLGGLLNPILIDTGASDATGGNFGITAADFDGDSKPDIAVADYSRGASVLRNNCAASPTISGRITDSTTRGISGVTVTLTGAQSATTQTDGGGNYLFSNLTAGANYLVTPSKENYRFNPANASVNNLSGTQVANFVATAMTVQFSSTFYSAGEGSGTVTLTVNRSGDTSAPASVKYATGDTAGLVSCGTVTGKASERCDYVTTIGTLSFAAGEISKTFSVPLLDDVWPEGFEDFTVTLSSPTGALLGSPSSALVSIADNDSSQPATNPIDGVDFFVRQQYLDILGRQPDQTGFQNWVNTLSGCPNGGFGEPPTSDCDRLHVAAGFFQSDEFLNRGYWAFRFYMVSFNQRPTYAQFIPDMSQVGGPKSPAEEEASKVAFADAFVQRPEFLSRYGGLTGQALADALTQNTGLPAYTITTGQTNGQILRAIAERQTSLDKFLTEGTVSILYFGFQRRDPDAIGYQNNVNTLNADPNNLRHMIFIFIYSSEYRGRFGPP